MNPEHVQTPQQSHSVDPSTRDTVGMVLGIVSLVIPVFGLAFGIAALVLGSLGRDQASKHRRKASTQANVGFWCGLVATAIYLLVALAAVA